MMVAATIVFVMAIVAVAAWPSSSATKKLNAGFAPEFATHLKCQSISTGNVVIDRTEPFGSTWKRAENFPVFHSLTDNRKRVWMIWMNDILCEETEL